MAKEDCALPVLLVIEDILGYGGTPWPNIVVSKIELITLKFMFLNGLVTHLRDVIYLDNSKNAMVTYNNLDVCRSMALSKTLVYIAHWPTEQDK